MSRSSMKIDYIVIIHNDNLPPGKWSMERVVELQSGDDEYVRVVRYQSLYFPVQPTNLIYKLFIHYVKVS